MRKSFTYMTKENMHTLCNGYTTIRAFKYSRADGRSHVYPKKTPTLVCKAGAVLEVPEANTSWTQSCAAGVNVATYDWCLNELGERSIGERSSIGAANRRGFKLWEVEFQHYHIACIPKGSTGKIRLVYCKVIREVTSKPRGLAPKKPRAGTTTR